ncbi:MAG: hypothetical protein IIW56_11555 [Oscillospiraceae bacterium]|nr:hypothetical protein [Oscillospiraceae bacterium]
MYKVSVPHGQKNNRPWRTEDINIGIASRQKIPDIVEWNDTELYPGAFRQQPSCARIVCGDSPQKAKTAGCRLRFMLEEKRKGKMKN